MTIQARLTLYCSIIFSVVFAVLAVLIYSSYYKYVEISMYDKLERIAHISAIFYFGEDELHSNDFEKIRLQYEETVSRYHSSYQIYNTGNKLIYGKEPSDIPTDIIDKIRDEKELSFTTDNYFCYGVLYNDNQGDFVVITKEDQLVVSEQMEGLFIVLASFFLIGLIAIILLSKWVSRIAYRPFGKVINQVKSISVNNLDVRIDTPNTKDELENLTKIFNSLLTKISETFVIQKNFVKYISHEFKTPLTSMLGNLEVFSTENSSVEEYERLSEKLIQQIHLMEDILNTLMIVSDLRKDNDAIVATRVDELVWEIIDKISEINPESRIEVNIDVPAEDMEIMSVEIDRTQLLMALFNLIENGVKYSKGKIVNVHIFASGDILCLAIIDRGIGIPPEQLSNINKPFFRANNTDMIQGYGIGLSITLRILEKNNIAFEITSEINVGTTVVLTF